MAGFFGAFAFDSANFSRQANSQITVLGASEGNLDSSSDCGLDPRVLWFRDIFSKVMRITRCHSERSEESPAYAGWENRRMRDKNMGKSYWLYITTNKSNTLYVGVTNDLHRRVYEHKNKIIKGFTFKYSIDKLVYYQEFSSPEEAIAAEKKVKGWTRKKKMELIKSINPEFKDLSQTS